MDWIMQEGIGEHDGYISLYFGFWYALRGCLRGSKSLNAVVYVFYHVLIVAQ